jgi:hypothetical protein
VGYDYSRRRSKHRDFRGVNRLSRNHCIRNPRQHSDFGRNRFARLTETVERLQDLYNRAIKRVSERHHREFNDLIPMEKVTDEEYLAPLGSE